MPKISLIEVPAPKILTVDKLLSLPNGTVLRDADGDVCFMVDTDNGSRPIHFIEPAQSAGCETLRMIRFTKEDLATLLPAQILTGAVLSITQ